MTTAAVEERIRRECAKRPKAADLVRTQPDLVRELAGPVGLYSKGGQWNTFRTLKAKGKLIPTARLTPKAKRLARALETADKLMRDPDIVGVLRWTASPVSNPKVRAAGGLGPWLEALGEVRAAAARAGALKSGRGRGAAPDPWRDRFVRGVAIAMYRCGAKPTRSRTGTFHEVLTAAFEATDEGAPSFDMFDLIKRNLDVLVAQIKAPRIRGTK